MPWRLYFDQLWLVLVRLILLFALFVFFVLLSTKFGTEPVELFHKILLWFMASGFAFALGLQAWGSYRLLRHGVVVVAEVVEMPLHGKEKESYKVLVRWTFAGETHEQKRLYPSNERWRPITDKLKADRILKLLSDPKRPRRCVPLDVYTDPRPRSSMAILFGK